MRNESKVTHVGLDCHKNFSCVTARDAQNGVVFRQRLDHRDRAAMRQQMAAWPAKTPAILEGTFGWGWVADELAQAGHEPHLASSRKVAAWRDARGMAKSNKLDADLLSELWPQQPRWWEVWLAPVQVRDERELMRCRMGLVQVQTALKNRIHATLHRHGVIWPGSDLFGKKGLEFLGGLLECDEPLRDSSRKSLRSLVLLLSQVRDQIAAMTRALRRQVQADGQAGIWRSLPGVGWVLACTIQAEIGDIGRFKHAKGLCSYSLLAPLAQDSGEEDGDTPQGRHVGHAGRRTLKWAFIEAAHGAVRKSGFFRSIFDRVTEGGKRDRNRGYITAARHLCRIGHACVRKNRRYSEDRPARPGSVQRKDKTPVGADA